MHLFLWLRLLVQPFEGVVLFKGTLMFEILLDFWVRAWTLLICSVRYFTIFKEVWYYLLILFLSYLVLCLLNLRFTTVLLTPFEFLFLLLSLSQIFKFLGFCFIEWIELVIFRFHVLLAFSFVFVLCDSLRVKSVLEFHLHLLLSFSLSLSHFLKIFVLKERRKHIFWVVSWGHTLKITFAWWCRAEQRRKCAFSELSLLSH